MINEFFLTKQLISSQNMYLCFQLRQVDAAGLICINGLDYHSGHLGWCRICSMGWYRNQTNVTLRLTNWIQISFNGPESGILSLGSAANVEIEISNRLDYVIAQ